MSALADFHFLRPWWLLALLPTGLLLHALWRQQRSTGDWQQLIDTELLPFLTDGSAQRTRQWPLLLVAVAWLLAIAAMSGPSWEKLPQPIYQQQDALVIALDLSASMYAQDQSPSRLIQARREIRDILKRRREGLTALIVFAGDAHIVVPLTDDTRTIELLLPALNPAMMPLTGSDPIAALRLAKELATGSQAQAVRVLLISDGIYASDFDALAAQTGQGQLQLSVLGIGTAAGAPIPLPNGGFLKNAAGEVIIATLNDRDIAQWARRSGVRYRGSNYSDADIDALLLPSARMRPVEHQASERAAQFDTWRDAGPVLILALLPLALLAFRRGWLLGLAFLTLLPSPQSHAFSWQDLWQRPDQQAQEALQEGQAERAAELFEDEQWRGVARYRAGDYSAAVEEFSADDDSSGHYNRGNALTQGGDLQAAIAAYERALELDPSNEDAATNKKVVEDMLKQQREQQQQDSENPDNPEGSEGSDNSDASEQGDSHPEGDSSPEQGESPPPGSSNDGEPGAEKPDQPEDESSAPPPGENEQASPRPDGAQGDDPDGQEAASTDPGHGDTSPEETSPEDEQLQQWLRQIPDEPGTLLQRKFDYQYRRQNQRARKERGEERY